MTTPRADIGAEAVKDADGIPEELLAAAVLKMALDDLCEPHRCSAKDDPIEILQEARRFCFSNDPEPRSVREFWCGAASVDPNSFQRLAAQRCAASLR